MFGSGSSSYLRAARNFTDASQNNNTRGTCSGVFVTKLDPKTSVRGLASAVDLHTGYRVKPEKLPAKHHSYSSFYIPCNRDVRAVLLDPSIWPKYSWVKPFYSREV